MEEPDVTLPQGHWTPPLLRGLRERWRACGARAQDGALALALVLLALAPNLSRIGAQIGDLPPRPENALSLALVLAQALPLAARRRRPAGALAVIAGAFAAHQALGFPTTFASTGLYLALYSAGAHQVRRRPYLAAASSAAYAVLAAVLHHLGSPQGPADYLAFYAALAAFWLLGSGVRGRRAREAERRTLAAEVAAADERARIARELHDVVTHHVTAMVIQADAAQYLPASAPERLGEALTAVSDTGRRALADLRHLLGVLEATGATDALDVAPTSPAPAPGRLADLVDQTRRTGQPVEFTEHGEHRPGSAESELAAYRVVQEALTNAVKHAAGVPTRVLLRHGERHTEVEVTTETAPGGPARRTPGTGSGGRGLDGLRTRVRLLDGSLEAGPRPEGGFRVRATIPLPAPTGEAP
ncbi:histidine kinase [Kitasatospora albolonga]